MVILMVVAACYGVAQLAVLGLATRTVRSSTLLLAIAVGGYACGVGAIIAEVAYTRAVHALTGRPMSAVVATASYTVDPFIEEVVKILPLVVVAVWGRRLRAQWGLTDFLLLGAAVGAGFALMESVLRFGSSPARSFPDGDGGFLIPTGLYPPHVHGLVDTLTSWLPPPVDTFDLFGTIGTGVNVHLVWTGLAGLGIGVAIRVRGWRRWLGLVPLLYAGVDHAANNYAIATVRGGVLGLLLDAMETVRNGLPVLVFLALITVVVIDVRTLRRARRDRPELLLATERGGRLRGAALARFAGVAPPWTPVVAIRFALVRRSVWYASAGGGSAARSALADEVVQIARQIDAARDRARWQRAGSELSAVVRRPRELLHTGPVLIWLLLAVPVLAYFVVGGVPSTGGVQKAMQTDAGLWVVGVVTCLGLAYGVWQLIRVTRTLPVRARQPWGEGLLRALLRVSVGVSAVSAGVAGVLLWPSGADGDDRVISNAHILDALASALLLTAVLVALAALFIMFPPGGAAVLVGGATVVGEAVTVAGVTITAAGALQVAGALGLAGLVLNAASSAGGGRSSGGGGTPRGNQAQNKQFRGAVREGERRLGRRLSKDEIQRVHREISHQDYSYQEIVELIVDLFG